MKRTATAAINSCASSNDSDSDNASQSSSSSSSSDSSTIDVPPSLVNLPDLAASIVGACLERRELLALIETSLEAVVLYRPCISQLLVSDWHAAEESGGLTSVLPKLQGLRVLKISLSLNGYVRGYCELLSTLAYMMAAGKLLALEKLQLSRRDSANVYFQNVVAMPSLIDAFIALFESIGEANAPQRLTHLHIHDSVIDEPVLTALATAVAARAGHGCAGFTRLNAGEWLNHSAPATQILRLALPSLVALDDEYLHSQPAIDALGQVLCTVPSPRPTLAALPGPCAAALAPSLCLRDLRALTRACRGARSAFSPYFAGMRIARKDVSASDHEEAIKVLAARMKQAPGLARVEAQELWRADWSLLSATTVALVRTGASMTLRCLSLVDVTPEVLEALGSAMWEGQLPALERLPLTLGGFSQDERHMEAFKELFDGLGSRQAPWHLSYLSIPHPQLEKPTAKALMAAVTMRHARGMAPFRQLDVGDWYNYEAASEDILHVCLPTLRALTLGIHHSASEEADRMLEYALAYLPARQLDNLQLCRRQYQDMSKRVAALSQGRFPRLRYLTLSFLDFNENPGAIPLLREALRHRFPSLLAFELAYRYVDSEQDAAELADIFREGHGPARLVGLRVRLKGRGAGAFDRRLAAAIEAGALPSLRKVECVDETLAWGMTYWATGGRKQQQPPPPGKAKTALAARLARTRARVA